MKQQILSTIAAVLLYATAAMATSMSSPNYTSNAGRIVSGGSAATDASGMAKAGIAIGQGVFMQPGGSSSPAYNDKPAALAAVADAIPVLLSALPDGATTSSSSLTISGTTISSVPPKNLTLNGVPVTVNSDGSFSTTVPLKPGVNTVTVASTNRFGVVITTNRTVIYNPAGIPVVVTSIANNSTIAMAQTTVPLGGTVGVNATGVTITVNGGQSQVVTPTGDTFSATSGTLVPGLNTIVITTTAADGSTSSSAITVWRDRTVSLLAHNGDINGDGVVDIVDALLALKSGVGLVQLTSSEISRGDVGPLVNSVAVGDGKIDIEDSMLILRKTVGLGW